MLKHLCHQTYFHAESHRDALYVPNMADQLNTIYFEVLLRHLKLQSWAAVQVLAAYNYPPPHPLLPPPEELITNYVRSLVQMVLSDGPAV